jgi:hypothetical protein
MTDRGLPSVDSAQACPFVAFEQDRDERATSPDHRHRCYAEPRPAPRAIAHQEAYCLSSAFPVCPTFQDWARREAARARGAGIGAPATGGAAAAGAAAPGAAAAGAGVAGAAGVAAADSVRRSPGNWPEPPSFATRASGPPTPVDEDRDAFDDDGADEREDRDDGDRNAPFYPPGRTEPGSGLAGSRADRVAMAGGAADAPGARAAWPEADLAGRRGGAADSARAAGAGAPGGGAAFGAPSRDTGPDDDFDPPFGDRDRDAREFDRPDDEPRDADERDYGRREPASRQPRDYESRDYPHRDERIEREEGERRGLFGGRDKRPKVGDTRRHDEDDAPAWERPRRYDSFPTTKTRTGMRNLSRILIAALLLFGAAIAVFFLPRLLITQPAGVPQVGASATASAGVQPSESALPTAAPSPSPFTYTVAPRDTMTKIARRFGVTVEQIMTANPTVKDANTLKIGDKLVIPTPVPSGASAVP